MANHLTHDMHPNSLEAYAKATQALTGRRRMVHQLIEQHGPMSDRQVRDRLGFSDMNAVRPRISELVDLGLLEEVGRRQEDGHTVRICGVPKFMGQLGLFS